MLANEYSSTSKNLQPRQSLELSTIIFQNKSEPRLFKIFQVLKLFPKYINLIINLMRQK